MNEIQQKIKEAKSNPILEGIPDNLKEIKQFKLVEKRILDIMKADHKHIKPSAFMKCKRCQARFNKKREYILGLGFKNIQQYQLWKKVMGIIVSKQIPILYKKV